MTPTEKKIAALGRTVGSLRESLRWLAGRRHTELSHEGRISDCADATCRQALECAFGNTTEVVRAAERARCVAVLRAREAEHRWACDHGAGPIVRERLLEAMLAAEALEALTDDE